MQCPVQLLALCDTRDRWGFNHLTFPNGEAFEILVGQIPHPPPQGKDGGIVGHIIDIGEQTVLRSHLR